MQGTFGSVAPDFTEIPVDELRVVAEELESVIAAGKRDADLQGASGVSVDSEIIAQAVRARAARHELVSGLLETQFAWERRDGLIWLLKTKEYAENISSRDRDRNALIVNGENGNRWALYEELLKVNNWAPRNLSAVQLIFHEERVKLMSASQLYETPSGDKAPAGR